MGSDSGATATASRPTPPAIRLAVDELAPDAAGALDAASRRSTLDPSLLELVGARVSQLNGCADCVDLHSRDARTGGETERRLYALPVWRETPFFSPTERAALDLAEAGTRISQGPVGDDVFQRAADAFSERELAELIWVIAVINTWNRLGAIARPWRLG
ncbi:MAG TPA: carboxymuconolactone decarboxylase family protein [Verrucomicrobiae bacterium]|nr:carboxymuconolactone decarboxylase family protein [Verrucomicrobiae bacterium]